MDNTPKHLASDSPTDAALDFRQREVSRWWKDGTTRIFVLREAETTHLLISEERNGNVAVDSKPFASPEEAMSWLDEHEELELRGSGWLKTT
jgi:hypothetical protein